MFSSGYPIPVIFAPKIPVFRNKIIQLLLANLRRPSVQRPRGRPTLRVSKRRVLTKNNEIKPLA